MHAKQFLQAVIVAALLLAAAVSSLLAQNAPGPPGSMPTWTDAGKEGLGTSTTTTSKVWFTLQGGILTEVYWPRLDNAVVRSLEFAVSDGSTVWVESKDMQHSVEWLDHNALFYRQTSRDLGGQFKITKTYATDPTHDALLIDVDFTAPQDYSLYVLYDPALNNTGYGDAGSSQDGILVAQKTGAASALASNVALTQTSTGFGGVSDGYTDLLLHHKLTWSYASAVNGNVIQAAKISGSHFTLSLGFGPDAAAAVASAKGGLQRGFPAVRADYLAGWKDYVGTLRQVQGKYAAQFRLATMTLKAHEDKTYRGAMIASMSIPWGYAVKADVVGVGGYHLVWARDLYEVATGLMAAGDRAGAERALNYLFTVQEQPDGRFPQNSWLDGRPYWTGIQMDQIAYPAILAWQLGKNDADTWQKHIRPEIEFLLAHGPATQQERWEEVGGYSPSTIAAEIAGLICAADIARKNGANDDADRYTKTADLWASNLETWLVTKTGHLGGASGAQGYYIRINNNTDPNDGNQLDVHNGGGVWDERDVVDAGFLELVRLGIRPADDATIARSLDVIDAVIRTETPNGPSFRRYNHDGYGETFFGGPWLGEGVGRLWPIFTGERGEYEIANGRDASLYLDSMLHFANAGGMIPEQVWDKADGTRARFAFGSGTGSATPLAWSMAQFIRLVVCAEEKKIVERPSIVADHFLKK